MSAKDTTGDKLIASIQKTKAQADSPAAETEKAAPKPAVANKAAPKKTASKKAAAKKATKKTTAAKKPGRTAQSNKAQLVDTFQRGRRVWPD